MRVKVKTVGLSQLQSRLQKLVEESGSYSGAAKRLRVSVPLVHDIAKGKRLPTPSVFRALGFAREVVRVYTYKSRSSGKKRSSLPA